jgi:hypothetical protein
MTASYSYSESDICMLPGIIDELSCPSSSSNPSIVTKSLPKSLFNILDECLIKRQSYPINTAVKLKSQIQKIQSEVKIKDKKKLINNNDKTKGIIFIFL